MNGPVDVAVVGVHSLVGETLVGLLEERGFPVGSLFLLDEEGGKRLEFRGGYVTVQDISVFDFAQVRIAFFAGSETLSADYVPEAAACGCVVIDHSEQFRFEPDVPLVVPEVNPQALAGFGRRNIVASPGGLVVSLMVALQPLHDAVGVVRANLATYQAVSALGKEGMDELAGQVTSLLNFRPVQARLFTRQIAFNVLGRTGAAEANGYTGEEMKLIWEAQKILEKDPILVNPTTAYVPVFFGDSVAVHLETRERITAARARELLSGTPGLVVLDGEDPSDFPTAVTEAAQQDDIYIGRIREDLSHPAGLDLWLVADAVRRGCALNSIQIAEILVKDHL